MKTNNWVYLFGKLAKAVEILVTNSHDARERVWIASKYLLLLSPESVPVSCSEDVKWIHRMLKRYPAEHPYKSELDATYHRTRQVTAVKIANRVWKLYHVMDAEVEQYLTRRKRSRIKPVAIGKLKEACN